MGERNRRIIEKNPGEQQPSRVLIVPFGCTNLTVPTSALDRANRECFTALLAKLAEEKIVAVITHDRELTESALLGPNRCTVEIEAHI